MPDITPETVSQIARLANLTLTAEENQRLTSQLGHILAYVEKLAELDTTGIPQTAHTLPLKNVWREDENRPCLNREEVLSQAPDAQEGCFRVPRIIE